MVSRTGNLKGKQEEGTSDPSPAPASPPLPEVLPRRGRGCLQAAACSNAFEHEHILLLCTCGAPEAACSTHGHRDQSETDLKAGRKIRGVIYKLVRKSTDLREKKKEEKKVKFLLPSRSFHVKAPSRTPDCIIWFFLKRLVMIRSSSTFPQGLCSQVRLPVFVGTSKSLENLGERQA